MWPHCHNTICLSGGARSLQEYGGYKRLVTRGRPTNNYKHPSYFTPQHHCQTPTNPYLLLSLFPPFLFSSRALFWCWMQMCSPAAGGKRGWIVIKREKKEKKKRSSFFVSPPPSPPGGCLPGETRRIRYERHSGQHWCERKWNRT